MTSPPPSTEAGRHYRLAVAAKLIDRITAEVRPPEVLVNTIGAFGAGDALSTTPKAAMLTSPSYSAMVARPKCNLNWRVALSGVVRDRTLYRGLGSPATALLATVTSTCGTGGSATASPRAL